MRQTRVDDLLAQVAVNSPTFSPDGRSLAFARTRPVLTAPAHIQSSLVGPEALSDVWLQDAPGRSPRNLTNGHTDNTGAWAPSWAPDGARLAFLSTRGGSISLWIWERATDRVRRVRTPGVKYTGSVNDSLYRWLDARRILCTIEADERETHLETRAGRSTRLATAAWERAARGELTATVLRSTEFQPGAQGFWIVDVESEVGRNVGTGTVEPSNPFRTSWVSPDGRTFAFARPIATPYSLAAAVRMGLPVSLDLVSLVGERLSLQQPLPENVHAISLQWSPDGKDLAFFANGPGPVDPILLYGTAAAAAMPVERPPLRGNPARLYRVNIAQGTVVPWDTGDINLGRLGAPPFFWTADGEIVVSAPRRESGVASGPPPSRGAPCCTIALNAVPIEPPAPTYWWVVNREGKTRRLVADGTPVPVSLRPIDGGKAFVGVRDGDVWRIEPRTGAVTNLTVDFEPSVVAFPSTGVASASAAAQLVIQTEVSGRGERPTSARTGRSLSYHRIDLARRTIAALPSPDSAARLLAFSPTTQSAAYTVHDRRGLFLWRSEATARPPELVVEENTYYRELALSDCRIIEYRSLNGEPLKGHVCLPADAVNGRRYPLIVSVRYGDSIADDYRLLGPYWTDVYTSAGYAHLQPAIPARLPNTIPEEGDSAVMAINGILPAVESAVALGVVDPQRLFIRGSSRGGWTVLATIGLTTRFKAAVSEVYGEGARIGPMDHNPTWRYGENTELRWADANGGMFKDYRPSDVPWWRDGDLYRRNDPLTYVDRVQTPVLLMHGDFDEIAPLDRSEDYFVALVSMRKPAELVRYWGEGHAFKTPANVRDQYQRTFAWFDRWGDISRDAQGHVIYEGDRVKSRNGAPPLTVEDFARIGPAAPTVAPSSASR